MKNLLLLALLLTVCLYSGCGGDDDGPGLLCNADAYANDIADEVSDFSDAAIAFTQDPSTANCNAYKSAAQNYLDALKRYDTCAAITGRADYLASQ